MNRHGVAGLAVSVALASGGCARIAGMGDRTPGIDVEVQRADRDILESRTLSHLAAIEVAVKDYVQAEGNIPPKLDLLVPKYMAEIPVVETGLRRHKATTEVRYYPSDVIRDRVVDSTRLKDTGRWGYVYNDRQVIIFVDCVHKDSRGRPWFQERGVF